MSDEQQAETRSPRPRGRPRGSGRKASSREAMHRGRPDNDGQGPLENFEYRPFE